MALLWTLAVEEHVYLGLPVLVAATPRRWLAAAVGLVTAIGLVLLHLDLARVLRIGDGDTATHTNMGVLVLGALLAVVVSRRPALRVRLGHRAVLAGGGATFVLALLAQWRPTLSTVQDLLPMRVEWVEITAALLLVAWAQAQAPERGGLFASTAMVRLGRLSYGIYLLHPIVLEFLHGRVGRDAPSQWLWAMPVSWLAAWLLAEAVHRGFEVHFLRLKQRFAHVVTRPVD